ncbi:hypothetical protein pb186bvf_020342 [Paramecium bursaria]
MKIKLLINQNLWVLANILDHEIIFYRFPFDDIVYKAKDIIRQNFHIVQIVANQQLTKEQLDEFLSKQEVLVIKEEIKKETYNAFQGLCCLEGKRVYIHEWIVDQINFKRGIDDDNDIKQDISFGSEQKSFHFNHKRRAQYIIEYTMMENITSYFDKNRNLRSLSPERNPNLRIYNNKMVGSGKFFLKKVHNRKVRNPNPLELNTQRYYVSSFINIQ